MTYDVRVLRLAIRDAYYATKRIKYIIHEGGELYETAHSSILIPIPESKNKIQVTIWPSSAVLEYLDEHNEPEHTCNFTGLSDASSCMYTIARVALEFLNGNFGHYLVKLDVNKETDQK